MLYIGIDLGTSAVKLLLMDGIFPLSYIAEQPMNVDARCVRN